ncbi:chloride transporter, chloride channel (ClC) family protein [Besnoitia besnoiti]|uniref:Chloride transporter, chloride channel (ClC) family protein n=1 Tax=Besnoitia besnoiti TaxID=94643 RepID=A0A2A9MBT0_BESBE|nr:chloride transporter, chloride channel (ClC) family protein [Besnoitia besnoiti]PFH35938.1 chloride transporter, chloride channel (ClC) family protein [Besnoitia besnoiti]
MRSEERALAGGSFSLGCASSPPPGAAASAHPSCARGVSAAALSSSSASSSTLPPSVPSAGSAACAQSSSSADFSTRHPSATSACSSAVAAAASLCSSAPFSSLSSSSSSSGPFSSLSSSSSSSALFSSLSSSSSSSAPFSSLSSSASFSAPFSSLSSSASFSAPFSSLSSSSSSSSSSVTCSSSSSSSSSSATCSPSSSSSASSATCSPSSSSSASSATCSPSPPPSSATVFSAASYPLSSSAPSSSSALSSCSSSSSSSYSSSFSSSSSCSSFSSSSSHSASSSSSSVSGSASRSLPSLPPHPCPALAAGSSSSSSQKLSSSFSSALAPSSLPEAAPKGAPGSERRYIFLKRKEESCERRYRTEGGEKHVGTLRLQADSLSSSLYRLPQAPSTLQPLQLVQAHGSLPSVSGALSAPLSSASSSCTMSSSSVSYSCSTPSFWLPRAPSPFTSPIASSSRTASWLPACAPLSGSIPSSASFSSSSLYPREGLGLADKLALPSSFKKETPRNSAYLSSSLPSAFASYAAVAPQATEVASSRWIQPPYRYPPLASSEVPSAPLSPSFPRFQSLAPFDFGVESSSAARRVLCKRLALPLCRGAIPHLVILRIKRVLWCFLLLRSLLLLLVSGLLASLLLSFFFHLSLRRSLLSVRTLRRRESQPRRTTFLRFLQLACIRRPRLRLPVRCVSPRLQARSLLRLEKRTTEEERRATARAAPSTLTPIGKNEDGEDELTSLYAWSPPSCPFAESPLEAAEGARTETLSASPLACVPASSPSCPCTASSPAASSVAVYAFFLFPASTPLSLGALSRVLDRGRVAESEEVTAAFPVTRLRRTPNVERLLSPL